MGIPLSELLDQETIDQLLGKKEVPKKDKEEKKLLLQARKSLDKRAQREEENSLLPGEKKCSFYSVYGPTGEITHKDDRGEPRETGSDAFLDMRKPIGRKILDGEQFEYTDKSFEPSYDPWKKIDENIDSMNSGGRPPEYEDNFWANIDQAQSESKKIKNSEFRKVAAEILKDGLRIAQDESGQKTDLLKSFGWYIDHFFNGKFNLVSGDLKKLSEIYNILGSMEGKNIDFEKYVTSRNFDFEDKYGIHFKDLASYKKNTILGLKSYLKQQKETDDLFYLMSQAKKLDDLSKYQEYKKNWEKNKALLQNYQLKDEITQDKIDNAYTPPYIIRKYNLGLLDNEDRKSLEVMLNRELLTRENRRRGGKFKPPKHKKAA